MTQERYSGSGTVKRLEEPRTDEPARRAAFRRRDRHFLFVLAGVLLLQFFTSLSSVVCVSVYRRRFAAAMSAASKAEKASVEAASTALLLHDQLVASGSVAAPDVAPVTRRVVGYGQSRSRNAIYIYRDIEEDGVVHREFVQRIPFSVLASEKFAPGPSQP